MSTYITNDNIERQLIWRYATKRFDPTKLISERDWKTLEQSLIQAPSSFGLQPWRAIVVEDAVVRAKLQSVSWNQPQVVESSHFIALAAKTSVSEIEVDDMLRHTCSVREIPLSSLTSYRSVILSFLAALDAQGSIESWCTHQAYLALGLLLSTAALLNIDASPLEGIDPTSYDEILDLKPLGLRTKVACALGYRSEQDAFSLYKKVRKSREELVLTR